MNEKFESVFHKQYVGGEGDVVVKGLKSLGKTEYCGLSYETVLAEYRRYVGVSEAELPEEILEQLRVSGKI